MEDIKCVVVEEYNYMDTMEVFPFPTEEKAQEYLINQYTKCIYEEETTKDHGDRFRKDLCYLHPYGDWAQMVFENDGSFFCYGYYTRTWRVVWLSKPEEE